MLQSNAVVVKYQQGDQGAEVSVEYDGKPRIYLGLQRSLFTAYWDSHISPLDFLVIASAKLPGVYPVSTCLLSDGQRTGLRSLPLTDLQKILEMTPSPYLIRIKAGSSDYVWQVWSEPEDVDQLENPDETAIVGTISQVQNLNAIEYLYRNTSTDGLPELVRDEVQRFLDTYPQELEPQIMQL